MARTRSIIAPGQQCTGVNRRGVQCRRRVASSALVPSSTAPGAPRYCTIHQRMAVNRQAPPRVLPANAYQQFLGTHYLLARSQCRFRPSAQVPPYVSASTADEIARALVKGPTAVDQRGGIYGYSVYGMCLTTYECRVE